MCVCVRERREVAFLYGNYKTFCSGRTSRGRERTSEEKLWDFPHLFIFSSRRELFLAGLRRRTRHGRPGILIRERDRRALRPRRGRCCTIDSHGARRSRSRRCTTTTIKNKPKNTSKHARSILSCLSPSRGSEAPSSGCCGLQRDSKPKLDVKKKTNQVTKYLSVFVLHALFS